MGRAMVPTTMVRRPRPGSMSLFDKPAENDLHGVVNLMTQAAEDDRDRKNSHSKPGCLAPCGKSLGPELAMDRLRRSGDCRW